MRLRIRQHLMVLVFFALISFLSFYQPLFHLTTHVPGESHTDFFHFHWNYWWIRHALTTPDLNVYMTDFVIFPAQNNLAYHTLTPFWFPLWAMLEPVVGTIGAMNLIFALSLTITGYFCFLLFISEGVRPGWALLGGIFLQITPFTIHSIHMSWLNMLGWFWLPLTILLWKQVVRYVNHKKVYVWVICLTFSLWGMGLTDLQYFVFDGFLLVPYGLFTVISIPQSATRLKLCGLGLITVLLAIGLLWIAGPLPYINDFDRDSLVSVTAERTFAMDFPFDYFTDTDDYFNVIPPKTVGFLPLLVLLVSLSANFFGRKKLQTGIKHRWLWLLIAIPPFILSAGATMTVFGLQIPLPYRLFHEIFEGVFRFPIRFSVVFIIPIMLFSFMTLSSLVKGYHRLLVIMILFPLFLMDMRPLRPVAIQQPFQSYNFYELIGKETGEGYDSYVLLEVPTAAGSGETWIGDSEAIKFQYYGITHGKRMINGFLARSPIVNFWYMRTDDPMLSWLGQRRLLEPENVERQLRERIFDWPIGYIVIHQERIGRDTTTNQEIIGFFNQLDELLCPVWVERDAIVYRTASHPDACPPRTPPEIEPGVFRINIGVEGDEKFIGWGWHYPEKIFDLPVRWTGDWADLVVGLSQHAPGNYPMAELHVDLPPDDYTLAITAQSLESERRLDVLVNDISIGEAVVTPDSLHPWSFDIPSDIIGDGQHIKITLSYDGTDTAGGRQLALMVSQVDFIRDEK